MYIKPILYLYVIVCVLCVVRGLVLAHASVHVHCGKCVVYPRSTNGGL